MASMTFQPIFIEDIGCILLTSLTNNLKDHCYVNRKVDCVKRALFSELFGGSCFVACMALFWKNEWKMMHAGVKTRLR